MKKNILVLVGFLCILPNLFSQTLHENTKIITSTTSDKEVVNEEVEVEMINNSTSEAVSSSKESESNEIEQTVQPIDKKSHSSRKKLKD